MRHVVSFLRSICELVLDPWDILLLSTGTNPCRPSVLQAFHELDGSALTIGTILVNGFISSFSFIKTLLLNDLRESHHA